MQGKHGQVMTVGGAMGMGDCRRGWLRLIIQTGFLLHSTCLNMSVATILRALDRVGGRAPGLLDSAWPCNSKAGGWGSTKPAWVGGTKFARVKCARVLSRSHRGVTRSHQVVQSGDLLRGERELALHRTQPGDLGGGESELALHRDDVGACDALPVCRTNNDATRGGRRVRRTPGYS